MSFIQYDISDGDFNPTCMFSCKLNRNHTEKHYHCHEFFELGIILSGKGYYKVDDVIYPVSEGDVLFLNPQMYHQSIIDDTSGSMVEFFMALSDFKLKGMEPNTFYLKDRNPILHSEDELKRKLFRLCASMDAENDVPRPGRYMMQKTYMMQIMLLLVRDQAMPLESQPGYSFEAFNKKYIIEQIMNYFEDHYNEKISLDRIAENMYLSPFYISKLFKAETGDTPINYLINVRMGKAKEILESGKANSIQDVALAVGYDDAYHFSKLFKKHYGTSPSRIRKAMN